MKEQRIGPSHFTTGVLAPFFMLWMLTICVVGNVHAQSGSSELSTLLVLCPDDASAAYKKQISVIRSHLSDVEIQIAQTAVSRLPTGSDADLEHVRRLAAVHQSFLVVWFDVPLSNRVYFYLHDNMGGQFILRALEADEEGITESRALVTRSTAVSALAIRAGQHESTVEDTVPSPPAPAPSPPISPPESSLRNHRFGLALGAVIEAPVYQQVVWGGVAISVSVHLSRRVVLGMGYALGKELQLRSKDLRLSLRRHPIYAELMTPFNAGRVSLAPALGVQAEIQMPEAHIYRADIGAVNERNRWRLGALLGVRASTELSSRVVLYGAPKVVVQLYDIEYGIRIDSDTVVLFRQNRVSFWGEMGIQVRF